ncbi:hypothetical protein CCP3SC15_5030002 [Gammaproteobacteria bacterium]
MIPSDTYLLLVVGSYPLLLDLTDIIVHTITTWTRRLSAGKVS